ncbi:hypothetical protein M2138_000043 [Dysgonomonadaceae bacterium PH5-43]|nr:hypothetical protein [Dysgonomonadaceae bacterium PH5-43]
MFKQLLSILLIFTVNILFLSHAVIPHHHHDGLPHFIITEKHADHNPSSNNSCCCNHGEAEEEGSCQLDLGIDAILTTEQDYHNLVCCNDCSHNDLLYQAILLYYNFELNLNCDYSNKIPPYLISYSSADVDGIVGLRAPPRI